MAIRCLGVRTRALLPLVSVFFCVFAFARPHPAQGQFDWDWGADNVKITVSGTYYDTRGRVGLDLRDNYSGRWYDYEPGSNKWYGIMWEAAGGNSFHIKRAHNLEDGTILIYQATFTQEANGDLIYVDWRAYHEGQDVTADVQRIDLGIALSFMGAFYPFKEEVGSRYSIRR
jgi:hypothetical protein